MIEKDFVSYEQSLKLNKLDFNELTRFGSETSLYNKEKNHVFYANYGFMYSGLSDGYILAPLKSEVFRWFREKYGLKFYIKEDIWNRWCTVKILRGEEYETIEDFASYEEAENACIDKLLEIINKK